MFHHLLVPTRTTMTFMDPSQVPIQNTTTPCNNLYQQQSQYNNMYQQQSQYNISGVSGYIEAEPPRCMYYRSQHSFPTSPQHNYKYDSPHKNYHEFERNVPFNMSSTPSTSSVLSTSPASPASLVSPVSPALMHYPPQNYMSHSIPQSVPNESPLSFLYPPCLPNPPTLLSPGLRRDVQQNTRPMMEPQQHHNWNSPHFPPHNRFHVERRLEYDSDQKRRRCQCPSCQGTVMPKYDKNGKRLHPCDMENCNKMYNKTSQLKTHLRSHTGERPYVCTWLHCIKTFTRSDELLRHMRTHTGEKNYQCSTCGKSFTRSDHLKKHHKIHD